MIMALLYVDWHDNSYVGLTYAPYPLLLLFLFTRSNLRILCLPIYCTLGK